MQKNKEMFIMSERLATDFTGIASDVKNSLDSFFCIPMKEDAFNIINQMKERNTKTKASSLGDLDKKLLDILKNDSIYFSENLKESPDGKIEAESLFTKAYEEAKADEEKKPSENRKKVSMFEDIQRNSATINKYTAYVSNLKSVDEIDKLFLEKLNVKYTEYKSSADYISRTVKRLLSEFNERNKEKDVYLYDLSESDRVLILKHFIRQFNWFKKIEEFDVEDVKALVRKKYKGKFELIDDDIFWYSTNQNASWDGRQITEGFIDAIAKMQGIIKYKAPFVKIDRNIYELIKCIIVEDKLIDESKLNDTKVLSDCFNDFYYDVELDWFKKPEEMGVTKEFCDILCRVVEPVRLTALAKNGEAKTLAACFKGGKIPSRANVFKNFNEIEMTPELCKIFYKMLRKVTNEEELRSQKAKDGTARTLAECFTIDSSNMQITSINSIIMCFYKLIYDEMDKVIENCTVKTSTYNDATKKGGDLYEKSRKKLNFYNYELLKIVDDLANAKFSNKGKTREYLYIFAIAFEMTSTGYDEDTWNTNSETGNIERKEDPRKKTDIQKNLFFDYYADNIINNMSRISGLSGQPSDESIIDGYGINYKNFAEIAFLWSINQKGSPTDKLKLAYEVIKYCKKNGHEKGIVEVEAEKKNEIALTKEYENLLLNFTDLNKEGIETFLINNYSCRTNRASIDINNKPETAKVLCMNYINNNILKHYKTVTAYLFNENILETKKISLLIDLLMLDDQGMFDFYKKEYYLKKNRCDSCSDNKEPSSLRCSAFSEKCEQWYYDYVCSLDTNDKNKFESKVIEYLEEKLENPENEFNKSFYHLSNQCTNEQNGIKYVLQNTEKRIKSTLDVIEREKDFKASRAIVLSLCYIEYILLNWYERVFSKYRFTHDFSQFYKDFCNGRSFLYKKKNKNLIETVEVQFKGADFYLKESGYQPVNAKNLFDISIVFMAYRDNYKQLFQYAGDELVSSYRMITEYNKKREKEIEENRKNENNISKDR